MVHPQAERLIKMFTDLCQRHRGEIYSAVLDWEIQEVKSPHYDEKLQTLVPIVVIDFK